MKRITTAILLITIASSALVSCGSKSSSSSDSSTLTTTGTTVQETSGEASSDAEKTSADTTETQTEETSFEPVTAEESKLIGGEIVGKWKLEADDGTEEYVLFNEDGTYRDITDFSDYFHFSNGKAIVFGDEGDFTFDGKTMTVLINGTEIYKMEKLSEVTTDTDYDGSYKDVSEVAESGLVAYYEIDGEKAFLSFDGAEYETNGNELKVIYHRAEADGIDEYKYGVDGDVLTVSGAEGFNTFTKVKEK